MVCVFGGGGGGGGWGGGGMGGQHTILYVSDGTLYYYGVCLQKMCV